MDQLLRLVFVSLLIAAVMGLAVLLLNPYQNTPIQITPGFERRYKKFAIYGAVKGPGIYEYEGEIRIEEAVQKAGGLLENADEAQANLTKWVDDGETIIIPTYDIVQPTLTPLGLSRINLNTADKLELMTLPGIGEKRAGDIIKLREKMGGFQSREDILQISGISDKLLENIYDLVFVE